MTVWPGDGGVTVVRVASIGEGSMANVSRINMGVHSGTHMDAPLHFVDGGADIARISLDKLMGEVLIIETTSSIIDASYLDGVSLEDVDAVFFKTPLSGRDGREPFFEKYPAITEDCARVLTEKGIRTVGTDYFSIELYNDEAFSVHKHLLSKNVAIIENLCMTDVEPGRYSFISLPLKIEGSDGSPCRVLLFK
jgi:arylformamidase